MESSLVQLGILFDPGKNFFVYVDALFVSSKQIGQTYILTCMENFQMMKKCKLIARTWKYTTNVIQGLVNQMRCYRLHSGHSENKYVSNSS